MPETGNAESPGSPRGGSPLLFGLLIAVAVIFPPIGLAFGLLVITAGSEESFSNQSRKRGGLLIGIAAAALVIQVVLGIIFILPKAVDHFKEQLLANDFANPYRSINPSGFRNPEFRGDTQNDMLLEALNPRTDPATAKKLYEDALVEIKNGSKEPLPRYLVASYYAYGEGGDKIIEDTDARNDEIERLIAEARGLKGQDKRSKSMMDMTMTPLYMQTRLHDDDVAGARSIAGELDNVRGVHIPGDYVKYIKRWAYNTFFEYWQVRDPDKALDEAFKTIPGMSFEGSTLLLGNFYYDVYGGLDSVFRLSLRLGREAEFFSMLDSLLETGEASGAGMDVYTALHYFRGSYLGEAGRWAEALDAYLAADSLTPGGPESEFAVYKAMFETGRRGEAARLMWDGIISGDARFREREIRYLYREYPAEGIEFLRSKLSGDDNRAAVLSNMAILAKDAGDDVLARAITGYFAMAESVDAGGESKKIIEAVASGDDDLASSIVRNANPGFVTKGDGLFAQAYVYAPDADAEDAARLARMAIEAEPYEYEPCFLIYDTYYDAMTRLGRTDEALDFLKTNAAANQYDKYPSYFYALKLRDNGRNREALDIYEELRLQWNYPTGPGMATVFFEFPGSAHDWFTRLNNVELYDIYVQTALNYKDLGDSGSYEHYLNLAASYSLERYEPMLQTVYFLMEKGRLREAGIVLDDMTFLPELGGRGSESYERLMNAYADLKAAGWVRERNFNPFRYGLGEGHPGPYKCGRD